MAGLLNQLKSTGIPQLVLITRCSPTYVTVQVWVLKERLNSKSMEIK